MVLPGRGQDTSCTRRIDLVPFDTSCQGTTSTYAMSHDGWTLTGEDVPGCSFDAFTRH